MLDYVGKKSVEFDFENNRVVFYGESRGAAVKKIFGESTASYV